MGKSLRILEAKTPGSVFRLAAPAHQKPLTGDDCAAQLFVDFNRQHPVTVRTVMSAFEAKDKLYASHTTFSVVINDNGEVVGLSALKDLVGAWPMSLASQRGCSIDEISVQDVMRPMWSLPSITYDQLQNLTIDELVALFNDIHADFLLITERKTEATNESVVLGLVSADDLGEQLDVQLDFSARPESFSDIVDAVRGKLG